VSMEVWAILLGFAVPAFVTWLKRCSWTTAQKALLAVAVSAAAAVGQEVVQLIAIDSPISLNSILRDSAIIFATASTFYTTIWEKVEGKVEAKLKPPAQVV